MASLTAYFIEILAFNFVTSIAMFTIIFYSRRKERQLTPLKGTAVFSIGWLGGTILTCLFELLFAVSGANVDSGQLRSGISIIMILSATYAAYSWLSEKRIANIAK